MRILPLLVGLTLALASSVPLFPEPNPRWQTLHTKLPTLLPILPQLAPAPSHTLLVTLATPAFKPLLFNWLCWLRYKAQWGNLPPNADTPLPLLVITSDESLARELSDHGIVVWWLRSVDLNSEEPAPDEAELLTHDLFLNLRLMDLLLSKASEHDPREQMLQWGSLHYQSLMLERTLALTALVGALTESQRVPASFRKREEKEWRAKVIAHDWEESRLEPEPFVGVKGVLVVDNDAVWLSSPNSFLAHPYRPDGTHPSIIYASDSAPTTRNSWGTHEMPCACFFYSRTSNHGAAQASDLDPFEELDEEEAEYRPADGAALAWRYTSLCHVAMLLKSIEQGRELSSLHSPSGGLELNQLVRAVAPSFQASSLGPAIFLASRKMRVLPPITHAQWLNAMSSGNVDDLDALLEAAGLDSKDATCIDLAQKNYHFSPNKLNSTLVTPQHHRPIRAEPLPYSSFPPGMSFFAGDQEKGIRPCVVHANYVTGSMKETLLRREGLWALEEGEELFCNSSLMEMK